MKLFAFIVFINFSFYVTCQVVNTKSSKDIHRAKELDDDTWREIFDGEWMIEFFAPWCPACKSLEPVWEKFAQKASQENIRVGKIDVTKSPSLSGRFFITALPTIYHVKNGEFRQYRGPRDEESLINFIRKKLWENMEQLPYWKRPDSIQMSVLSFIFKISHFLKDVNTQIHETYGLPTWAAYVIFAIVTIFIGAILGLFLVCLVDFIYPPNKGSRESTKAAKNNYNELDDLKEEIQENDEKEEDKSKAKTIKSE
ncbi:thioredoxin-related transmembrane protein 1-like [Condylostylus longicornis]|uniref:thioredoxin-related transmembrane protein 1-like n=1 Tax=Condylostylus longicornis TaxID=2530218 RepID=UPI00244E178E|nr:thioredoxin-related transmembrane protein 1-like [Condylostylus longicornis]XP_055383139.1 thioredoxin-related transmembrane protein 1-like [Condylostylus longicornis]